MSWTTWSTVHPRLARFLVVSAKQAVNAVFTNTGLAIAFPSTFNTHQLLSFVKAIAVLIVSREATVWLPVIIQWSATMVSTLTLAGLR